MSRPVVVFLIATLSLLTSRPAAVSAELLPDVPPIERAIAEDLKPSIVWRETLEESLDANADLWNDELRKVDPDAI